MDSHRWQRLKLILAEALEQESPAARTALVGRSCGNDADLLREIESLLAEAEPLRETPDELEECADNFAAALPREGASEIGKRIGAYMIIRKIGQGGMGTVYLAARADGYFEKQVAIKLLKRGVVNEEVLRRFRSEREVLARLDHPNIARLIDAGTTDDGLPYFVMEYIDGIPITRFLDEKQEGLAARLNLFLKISAAVEAAHRNSVIHRDLKPNNILVNREGEPKLLDFGIAKVVGNNTNPVELTTFGQERLTPISASPEQAKGEPVTISSDIYGLGVVLYEMLTGVRPHRFLTSDPSREELVEVVCKQLPTLPSLVVKSRERQRQLRGDLDAILLRALQKEPTLRYPSVAEFAEDIRRHLVGEPVRAREHKAGYRIKARLLHNRAIQLSLAATILALLIAAAFIFGSRVRSGLKQLGVQAPAVSSGLGNAPSLSEKSIAVLPFENLSHDPDNAYFAEGMQDEILARLSKIADLKVISRTSTLKYKSAPDNLREIAKQLGVGNVLEGSVQKSGDAVRVNVQLINALNDAHLWGDVYDRKLTDIFAVESDIAKTIADTLQAKLTGEEKQSIAAQPTSDLTAYELYLKGRSLWGKRSGDNLPKAIAFYEQAIARDPNYALAYAGLAEAYVILPSYTATAPQDAYPTAKAAALKALQLDEKLAEAHTALGLLLCIGDLDMAGSISEFQRAIALKPNYATAHHWYGNGPLLALGRFEEAIAEGKRAVGLDPLSPIINADLGQNLYDARRYDEAIAQLRKTLEIDPTFYYTHYNLGMALQRKGDVPAAIAEYTKAQQLSDDLFVQVLLAAAKAQSGDKDAAIQMLAELEELSQHRYVSSYFRTRLYLSLGNRDEAIRRLEQAIADHESLTIIWIKVDPMLDPLRGDPRFEALVQKVVGVEQK